MEYLTVGFSRPKKWFSPFSWIIRLVQQTSYSHVYIKFYSAKYRRFLVYQASGLKVNFIGWDKFQQEEIIIKEFNLDTTENAKYNMICYAIDKVGSSYSMKEVLGAGLVLLFRTFNKKIDNPFNDGEQSFFCSQLVDYILKDFIDFKIPFDPSIVLPKDIYNYLEKKNG